MVDRRLNEVAEEMPLRLQSYISSFEKREQLHMQDVNQKLAMTQESNIRLRDQVKGKLVEIIDQVQRVEMQAKETEYRLATALKQVELQGQMIAAI